MAYNEISRIDKNILSSSKVRVLDLTGNPLQIIETGIFVKLDNLQNLNLSSSGINEIPVLPESVLQLTVSSNKIADIKPVHLQNLHALDIESNYIERIDKSTFSGSALEVINLSRNKIATIEPYSFGNVSKLYELSLIDNKLTRIDQDDFAGSTVKIIELVFNQIAFIEPGAFFGLHLLRLDLSSNKITEIDKNTFAGCTVEKLILDYNQIRTIEPYAFIDVTDLRELHLEQNRISKIERNTFKSPTLKDLYMFGNGILNLSINDFEQISGLSSLKIPAVYHLKNEK